jgi:exosortase/archaeosortase family protein
LRKAGAASDFGPDTRKQRAEKGTPVFAWHAAGKKSLRHRTDAEIESDAVARHRPWLSRSELFSGLAIVGFANGASERAGDEIARSGIVGAFFNTFDVSVVVWAALLVAVWLLLSAERARVGAADIAVGTAAAIAFLIPVPSLAWLAMAAMAAYLVWTSAPRSRMRRAAVLIGVLTVPMLWARLVFAALSNTLLGIDAKLVGWVVGTQSAGNAIPFADGSGMLFLEPACSSLTNLSLALLLGVVFVKAYDRQWTGPIVATMLLACAATVAINVTRISVIGVFPDTYELMHGGIGATVAAWTTVIAITLIYTKWIKPDAPDPA